ncbi:uncharacterized protein FOMMEDRAFT_151951 [Fomitiporia mediterranea MF3/22]|uniref:uncharacterized protein n=1 Tax=Fomitiporia mediterranea (strain MF3/22) TaxID=694068 RepID=UPI000440814E|nr:uncharacterized protein FOMMEDRAFT_151951 [Fomitiporia mediterranea MF3/22]EJD06655.1 hypothetical protein FOMMEDRAFT_151951 [Fomitiporia mediterranea MF3/22]
MSSATPVFSAKCLADELEDEAQSSKHLLTPKHALLNTTHTHTDTCGAGMPYKCICAGPSKHTHPLTESGLFQLKLRFFKSADPLSNMNHPSSCRKHVFMERGTMTVVLVPVASTGKCDSDVSRESDYTSDVAGALRDTHISKYLYTTSVDIARSDV